MTTTTDLASRQPRARSLSTALSILTLAAALPGCLAGDEPADDVADDVAARETAPTPLLPVSMHPRLDEAGNPIAGTLVFDTSDGRLDITELVPGRPREFRSRPDFLHWMASTLNASLVERDRGELSSSIDYTAATTVRFDRDRSDFVVVDDPVAAIIGGAEGFVVVAGEKVCTSRTAECSLEAGLALPTPTTRTVVPWYASGASPSGSISIFGTTWDATSSFLQWVGANTFQTGGGIKFNWMRCGPGNVLWCYTRTGSNFLTTSYVASRSSSPVFSGASAASNTYAVMASRVDFYFFPAFLTDRTCATHFGTSNGSSISLISGFVLPFFPNNC